METDNGVGNAPLLVQNAMAASGLFSRWRPELIAQVARAACLRHYERGGIISTGSGSQRQALLVVSGFVEISQINARGRRFVLRILGPGLVTGLVRLLDDTHLDHGYFARERAQVAHLPCAELIAALDSDPMQWKGVLRSVLHGHADLLANVFNQLIGGTPEQRVPATLRRLSRGFGVQAGEGVRLRLRLSQDDLADMLCVSRQTVNKALKRLDDDGVISSTYSAITILDRAALDKLVEDAFGAIDPSASRHPPVAQRMEVDRRREDHRVEPVEHPAMAFDHGAPVLDAPIALDGRHDQAAE